MATIQTGQKFHAKIEGTQKGRVYIPLPFDPAEVWGERGHYYVAGTINGMKIRGRLDEYAKGHFLPLGPAYRRDTGLRLGDMVDVVLVDEHPPRVGLAVWKDPRTSARDRKRMLRLLIDDVTLARDGELIRVHIRWKGGATTSLEVSRSRPYFEFIRTPAATIEAIRALAAEQTDGQIAHILNSRLYRSGAGKSFTGLMVRQLRLSYGIESYGQQLRRIGWLTPPEIASSIGVHPKTARTYAKKGLLHAVRINDKGDLLFEPPAGPIPCAHRGKRYRDRPARTDVNPQMRNEVQYET